MIGPTDAPLFPGIEDLLSWTSKRQQALSANIANIDTPDYRAKDYNFNEQLAMIDLSATSSKHITPSEESNHAQLYEVGTEVKPNGNNVDLEREMKEITKNALQYITLVQYLNQKIRTLRTAITEGGK
jgi:flagellar basal-body rod protein FlgB